MNPQKGNDKSQKNRINDRIFHDIDQCLLNFSLIPFSFPVLRLKCQYNNGIHIVQRNRAHDHQRPHGRRSVNIVDKCHSHDGCTASERRLYKRTTDTVIFDRKFTDPPDAPETDTADNCTVQYKFQIKYF